MEQVNDLLLLTALSQTAISPLQSPHEADILLIFQVRDLETFLTLMIVKNTFYKAIPYLCVYVCIQPKPVSQTNAYLLIWNTLGCFLIYFILSNAGCNSLN